MINLLKLLFSNSISKSTGGELIKDVINVNVIAIKKGRIFDGDSSSKKLRVGGTKGSLGEFLQNLERDEYRERER